ncbi:MAG TPA: M20/M25/M40 family metallo-hydrolase [Gemmatimonadales bacterium]|nr:M20/M25/M40 family metallo-hydrolase [Gemmatimonadales bacterium]
MDPVELTRALVALETPTFSEGAATELLAARLVDLGYRVELQLVTPGRHNLYAWKQPPVVVFSTHLDCVPPYVPLREDAEAIYGRGSCDAKGIAAAMVAAAEELATSGERRIGLLFLVGEENGSDGAMAAESLTPKGRWLINGEPTENRLVIGQKGSIRMELESMGQAAHSAYPAEGRSAIVPLLETLDRIRKLEFPADPLLGEVTVNIGTISGGVAPNVIPPHASAQVLIRTVGDTEELKRRLTAAAAPEVKVTFPVELVPYRGKAPAGWETSVVSFASDLPVLASWGERFQMGPGSIRVAHTDRELLRKADLFEGIRLYVRLARELLTVGLQPKP